MRVGRTCLSSGIASPGQAERWISAERRRDISYVKAVFEWILENLCESESDVASWEAGVPEVARMPRTFLS